MYNAFVVVFGVVVLLVFLFGLLLVFTSAAMVLREIINLHKKRRW